MYRMYLISVASPELHSCQVMCSFAIEAKYPTQHALEMSFDKILLRISQLSFLKKNKKLFMY